MLSDLTDRTLGIVGGFAPPTPDAIHTLSKSSDQNVLTIASAVRPEGTPELESFAPKQLEHTTAHSTLVDELYFILKGLPVESPPGSEDIYGLDTSIMWGSPDLEWMNAGPEGC